MATDQGPVVQSALLRSELVRLRKESDLTQERVASDLAWSPSKLIRLEGGRSSITQVDLDALLRVYRVTSESLRERLHALNRGAHERGWWVSYRDDIDPQYLNYVGFEAGATFIRQFQNGFVPGLLQTAEYAEAVTIVGSVEPEKVGSVVGLRLQRRAELEQRSAPPRRYFVIDEGVIRRQVGIKKDRAVMPNQLRSIADTAERDDLVTVRVMPFAAGANPGQFGPFTILEFEGGLPNILYIDQGRGAPTMIAGDSPQVAEYADDFERLLEDALPAEESIGLIRSVADEISKSD
jgi:transcriptional regulator with XRE-family HTH domain